MKFLARLERVLHEFDRILYVVAGICLVGLVAMVGADILLRSVFNKPLGWVKEISEYIMIFFPFLLAAWIMEEDGHIKMDLIINNVSPRVRNVMNSVTYILSAIVVLILLCFSLRVTLNLYQTHYFTPTILQLPKFIFIAVISLGFLILFLQLVLKIYGFISNRGSLSETKDHP
jgi:TRAP-type C4-dicarboxylate transport system permease small subunit